MGLQTRSRVLAGARSGLSLREGRAEGQYAGVAMPPATAVRRSSDITCCISVRPARNGISNQQYKQQSQQEVSNRYDHAVLADVVL